MENGQRNDQKLKAQQKSKAWPKKENSQRHVQKVKAWPKIKAAKNLSGQKITAWPQGNGTAKLGNGQRAKACPKIKDMAKKGKQPKA